MAGASQKKLAVKNKSILDQLLYISIGVNLLTLFVIFYFKRPSNYIPYLIFQIPSIILQNLLEKNGRPKYNSAGQLVKSGDDILQKGSLFQYCFDIIYLTWFFNILTILLGSNKVWYLYSIIPGYIVYKLSGFILPFFKKSKPVVGEEVGETSATSKDSSGLSKRQQKLKARQEKGPSTKYR
ncbi:uncharacterized protein KGF55_004138 [Candida pseudojiufengensis]|uniref:uncharacterized protein n=1 Tax=Candida pseudojiufengensis TaxID=497109 RepID=UPI0022246A51|nr:uncharacterized protein KGF55_004138 [Candida pseudojiufengensis]KAI5961213.1 hypothetical protein KGF55_004138 [Candida pseudojiufengensis]